MGVCVWMCVYNVSGLHMFTHTRLSMAQSAVTPHCSMILIQCLTDIKIKTTSKVWYTTTNLWHLANLKFQPKSLFYPWGESVCHCGLHSKTGWCCTCFFAKTTLHFLWGFSCSCVLWSLTAVYLPHHINGQLLRGRLFNKVSLEKCSKSPFYLQWFSIHLIFDSMIYLAEDTSHQWCECS